jgi:hypothetical protein
MELNRIYEYLGGRPMAETKIEMDADRLVRFLQSSGLDVEKLNLKDAFQDASALDFQEMESRLKMASAAQAAAARWKVTVSISF